MTIQKLTTDRVGPFIDRYYRETSRLQWVRETAVNGIEAEADRIFFGVEWQGVVNHNVYRRTIIDNGGGMDDRELERFFGTFGGGGKPIGAAHENFGIGAKTTLLPWNHLGIVVISWKDGLANMIRIKRDAATGEYGLHEYEVQDDDGNVYKETVIEPGYDGEFDLDWNKVKPDWISAHGTVIVLLGNNPEQDTILGDPEREEDGIRMLPQYLNHRFWRPPVQIQTLEFGRISSKAEWPKRPIDRPNPNMERDRYMHRSVFGAAHYIATPSTYPKLGLKQGTVMVAGGTVAIDWYLWEVTDKSPRDNRGPRTGSIGVLYKNELYNQQNQIPAFRAFGVCETAVRNNLWLVIRPPLGDGPGGGIYPRADRSSLVWGGGRGGDELPINEWADEFAGNMPGAIIEALKRARKDNPSSLDDDAWRAKLAQRFGSRLMLVRYRPDENGAAKSAASNIVKLVIPVITTPPDPDRIRRPRQRPRTRNSQTPSFASSGNEQRATERALRLGLPNCVYTDNADDLEPSMLAGWTAPNAAEPCGLIQIYRGHPMFQHIVALFQKDYEGYQADKVRDVVEQCYKEVAVCKVAQIHEMRRFVGQRTMDEMLSPRALTAALLGMISEDAMIRQRLVGTIGRRRRKTVTPLAAALSA
jgi:hypothetical protein